MVFSSITFIFYFLPVVLLLYLIAEKTDHISMKNAVVLTASLVFYSWGGIQYLFLLLFLILINYECGRRIADTRHRKLFLAIGLAIDILDLLIFKYLNFLVENAEALVTMVTKQPCSFGVPEITLPIGISFFTFQIMSYLIDVYRRDTPVQKNIGRLALYIMMFPQLIAGPIVRYSTVNEEINERHTTLDMAERGIKRFMIGFAKKVFIANGVGSIADHAFALTGDFATSYAWMGAVCYALQIYYDFSAYSDMAIGLGLIFGFHFDENFDYPYISKSITEFWRRWHISLSTWFRDYVYIPLGGNRKGEKRTYINLFIVFLLTGIWHGAAWQFIIWGLYHGAFRLLEKAGFDKILKKLPSGLQHLYALLVVMIGWVFFRADSLAAAVNYVRNMFSLHFTGYSMLNVEQNFNSLFWLIFVLSLVFATPIMKKPQGRPTGLAAAGTRVGYLVVFGLSIIYLAGLSYNPFIYFKF